MKAGSGAMGGAAAAGLGLARLFLTTGVLFGTLSGQFFALFLFALLGLDLGAATVALILALLLFLLTSLRVLGLAGLGHLQRLQATIHFSVGGAGLLTTLRVYRGRGLATGFGDRNALALGLHHNIVGTSTGKALLYGAATRATRKSEGFLAVLIAHAFPVSFSAAGVLPFTCLMP